MKFLKSVQVFLVAILIIGLATPISTQAAVAKSGDLMKITKTVSNNTVVKGETTDVTMTVQGTPKDSTFIKPNDVILIVDKSGSMQADNRINAAKEATKEFIELMDLTKHEVGIVDYSSNASSFPLTTDKTAAKAYVDTIQLGGGTNTSAAINAAVAMLTNKRPEAQPTIVIMTDGAADSSPAALAAAKAAKDAGITFYSIALLAPNENPDTSAPNNLLKEMASSFDHHHFVLGSVGLSDVYKQIVEEIGLASAYNVTITDTIAPEFELVTGSYDHHIPKPTVTGNTIQWFISELKTNELSFTYQVRAKTDATAGKYPVAQTDTTFEMGDGSTYSMNTVNPIVEIKNFAPIITSITEDKGITAGGETVTITGQNFLPGVQVYFEAALGTVVSVNDNEIIVTTPAGKQGPVVVKVENTDRQSALGDFSYYADPTITSITPAEGPLDGGNSITINGSNYLKGAIVYIDDVETVTTFVSNSVLRAIVPAVTQEGSAAVKIVNPDNTSVEVIDGYTYLAPPPAPGIELVSLSPASGKLEGGEAILLTGQNFDRNAKVYFGDQEATATTFLSAKSIRVTAPQGVTTGSVTVKVVNPDNTTAELTDAYEYLAPPVKPAVELDSLNPASGEITGGNTILLTGKNFDRNVTAYFGDQAVTATTFLSATSIRVIAPEGVTPGLVSVKVENPDGSIATLIDAYEYLAPPVKPAVELDSLNAASGVITGGNTIILTGKNFDRNVTAYFGDQAVTATTFLSATSIRVIAPEGVTPGLVSVKVENPDGSIATLIDAYEYLAAPPLPTPEVTSLSEDTILTGQSKPILVYGTNLTKTSKVFFGDQEATVTYLATTRVRATVPVSNVPETVDVTVVNADGQTAVLPNSFTYTDPVADPAPIITSLSSNAGSLLGNETITITGEHFKKGATVYFGDTLGRVTSVSDTAITVVTPASLQKASVSVKVVNPDQQEVILLDGYLYEAVKPIITKLSSDNGAATSNNVIIIYGANFTKNMTVTVAGNPVSYTYLAKDRIRITVPASTPGVVDITIELGGETATTQFTQN